MGLGDVYKRQARHEVEVEHPRHRFDRDGNTLSARQRDQEVEDVVCRTTIGAGKGDGRRLFLNVVDIIALQHEAQESIFERTLELDDARARKARKGCHHRAAQAPLAAARNRSGRVARFWPAVDQVLIHRDWSAPRLGADACGPELAWCGIPLCLE